MSPQHLRSELLKARIREEEIEDIVAWWARRSWA